MRARKTYMALGIFVLAFIALAVFFGTRPNDDWAFNKPDAQHPLAQELHSFH